MALLKSKYATELGAAKLTDLLTKIKGLVATKKGRIVIDKGAVRYHGESLTTITITPGSSVGCLVFDNGSGVQTYDKADITEIKRLRTKKWKIILKATANPA